MTFGEKLLQLRKKNGYSQEELAEKLDVSRQAISRWEEIQTPYMQTVEFLIKFVPLLASSIWMAFNLKYEKDEVQYRKM